MRKEYGKIARKLFLDNAKEKLPAFIARSDLKDALLPGEIALSQDLNQISAFIIFVPIRRGDDAFTIECGWSTRMKFPANLNRPTGFLFKPVREISDTNYFFQLSNLENKPDFWWVIEKHDGSLDFIINGPKPVTAEEARGRIDPLMNDAFNTIKRLALPFFDELDQHFETMKTNS
jgi:hypothetical protein